MKKEEVAQTWKGPKSACKCGHSGDGRLSAHRDGVVSFGHGSCTAQGCNCGQFMWKGFYSDFQKALTNAE